MGLLDFLNTDESRLGMGLLAAAGPSATPMSFGQRLQGAMSDIEAQKLQKMRGGLLQSQIDENTAQVNDRKRKAANEQGLAGLMPQYFQPGGAADIRGFTGEALRRGLMNPMDAIKLQQATQQDTPFGKVDPKDFTSESVAKFAASRSYGDLIAAPKASNPDSKIEQYEYAKKNGYKGTIEQFISIGPSIMAGAMAPLRSAQINSMQAEDDYKLPAPRPSNGASGGVSVSVGGKNFKFPNQAAANQFKFEAGIK